ncbi:MAG: hypothetical protein ACHQ4J_05020 [Candidatus Binatia bacterium]
MPIAKVGIIAIVVVTLLGFVPLLGGFVDSPGIQAFLEGVIIFTALSGSVVEQIISDSHVQGNVYPGLWECIGFLVIAGVLVKLITLGVALIISIQELLGVLITVAVAPSPGLLGGIIPLFMYGSYIRLSLAQLIGR